MPDTSDPHSPGNPAAGAAGGSGCVIFLINESNAMDARVAGGTKSKAESTATALNSLLNQLAAGPEVDAAVVGYRTVGEGEQDIGSRWGGALAGRQLVPSSQLAAAPLAIEDRVRKVPAPGGVGVAREETVRFPVWYVPRLGGAAPAAVAFEHCRQIVADWLSGAGPNPKPPLVVSFVGELSGEETPDAVGGKLQEMVTPGGPPLVVHAHLSSSDRVPATLYPSSDLHLPPGPIRALFQGASVLTESMVGSLRGLQVRVNPGARGVIYNARMADLIRFLSLVKAYARYEPAAPSAAAPSAATGDAPTVHLPAPDAETAQISSAETPRTDESASGPPLPTTSQATAASATASAEKAVPDSGQHTVLVVLLLDRSVEDPPGDQGEKNVWHRLQAHANEILEQISKGARGRIDCAMVCYGADAEGQTEVQTTFSGPLAGRTVVGTTELGGGALRVEVVTEQVSNGIGGLVTRAREKPVFVEQAPTSAASPLPAFAAVRQLVAEWRKEHPGSGALPVVVHLTRGRFEPDQIEAAVGELREVGEVTLYHLVVTESPHPSLAYTADPAGMRSPELAKLWELSSPLLGRETLVHRKAAVSSQSRGIVINGKFDLLFEGIEAAVTASEAGPPPATDQ